MTTEALSLLLEPYTTNKNTGNVYEIIVILEFARYLYPTEVAELNVTTGILERILRYNNKPHVIKILTTYLNAIATKSEPKSNPAHPLVFDGHVIVGMRNVTQSDSEGKTGDLQLITEDGTILSVSVCEGTQARNGSVQKCLSNPSARRLGATVEDMELFRQRAKDAVVAFKEFMTNKYGTDESVWPSRQKTHIARDACNDVATKTVARFETRSLEDRRKLVEDLLRKDSLSARPADYLALVKKASKKPLPQFYRFSDCVLTGEWEPSIEASGIMLKLYSAPSKKPIGEIQVKFNNGIYHKGKTSSISTSWNFTVNLTALFNLRSIQGPTAQT